MTKDTGGPAGLSPLARGNQVGIAQVGTAQGPIPARAGEPLAPKSLVQKEKHQFRCKILKSFFRHPAARYPHSVQFY